MSALATHPGYVYFIQSGVFGPVKIGWARDPQKRLALLQTGSSQELHLLAAFPGSRTTERELHELFAGDQIRGEWFKPERDLLEYAQRLAT